MRLALLVVWLIVPLVAAAYHFGPGQERLQRDVALGALAEADALAADEQWAEAVSRYSDAIEQLPAQEQELSRHARLERAKARMLARGLPEAHAELTELVDELNADATADSGLRVAAQATLANSQYYLTWLMRLEGRPREEWEPEIEAARQTFRLLAESAEGNQHGENATRYRHDLEAAVRLARLDLKELQGLPLPSQ